MDDKTRQREHEPHRGREAEAPQQIPPRGWKDVLWRTWGEINDDRVTLVAAGVTYFLLLSLFPTLTAFVSLYGLFNDPSTVASQLSLLANIVPAGGLEVINDQLTRLTQQGGLTLGVGLIVSLAIALWSASTGIKNMFEAMNITYEEREKRNFFVLNGLALLFTLGGLLAAMLMIAVVVILPAVLSLLGLAQGFEWLVQGLGYLLVAAVLFGGILVLYRWGPSRQGAKWRWLVPGALFSVAVILIASLLFSWYSANFANYEKTYGSLGALIGFLTWIWISVTVVIVGAELNAEMEHQTARDSTVGADAPMGMRDATMADTLGKSTGEGGDAVEMEDKPAAWREGYRAGRKSMPRRHLSAGSLIFAVPVALALTWLERRRHGHPAKGSPAE